MKGYDGSHLVIICEGIALAVLGIAWWLDKLWEDHKDKEIKENCWADSVNKNERG